MKRLLIFSLMIFVLASSVYATGISPAILDRDFTSDFEETIKFRVVNDNSEDLNLLIYPRGDLAKYVTIKDNNIHVTKDQREVEIVYTVNVPFSIKKPGENIIEIVVEETISDKEGEIGITPKLALVHRLTLEALAPGTFADVKFTVNNPEHADELRFGFALDNKGTNDIGKFDVDLEIFNTREQSQGTISYVFGRLIKGEKRLETTTFNKILLPGKYIASARINYGGKSILKEERFTVEEPYISINDIISDSFNIRGINKIDFSIYSNWSEEIDKVFFDLVVKNKKGNLVGTFDTVLVNIAPFSDSIATGYWDTSDVGLGEYILEATLRYAGKITKESFEISLSPNELSVRGLSGRVVSGAVKSNSSILPILALGFFVLLIVNVILIIYLRKRKPPEVQNFGVEMNMIFSIWSIFLLMGYTYIVSKRLQFTSVFNKVYTYIVSRKLQFMAKIYTYIVSIWRDR